MPAPWQQHATAQLVAQWDSGTSTAAVARKKAGDDVTDEERARRVAEHVECAPSAEFLDALEQGLFDARKTGVGFHVCREGRGHYAWRVGNGKLVSEGQR